jgi:hypothetical protein
VLLGNWLAGESIGQREISAMAIILGSVVLLTTAKRPPVKADEENGNSLAKSVT